MLWGGRGREVRRDGREGEGVGEGGLDDGGDSTNRWER